MPARLTLRWMPLQRSWNWNRSRAQSWECCQVLTTLLRSSQTYLVNLLPCSTVELKVTHCINVWMPSSKTLKCSLCQKVSQRSSASRTKWNAKSAIEYNMPLHSTLHLKLWGRHCMLHEIRGIRVTVSWKFMKRCVKTWNKLSSKHDMLAAIAT